MLVNIRQNIYKMDPDFTNSYSDMFFQFEKSATSRYLADLKTCCKLHFQFQKPVPIQPKTSQTVAEVCQKVYISSASFMLQSFLSHTLSRSPRRSSAAGSAARRPRPGARGRSPAGTSPCSRTSTASAGREAPPLVASPPPWLFAFSFRKTFALP